MTYVHLVKDFILRLCCRVSDEGIFTEETD